MSWLPTQPADAIVSARDKHDVVEAVKICNNYKMPVIGIGSSLEGQLNAPHGDGAIQMMQAIKHAIDPNNIMNPDKIWFK